MDQLRLLTYHRHSPKLMLRPSPPRIPNGFVGIPPLAPYQLAVLAYVQLLLARLVRGELDVRFPP